MAEYIERESLLTKAIKEKKFVFQTADLLNEEVIVRTVYKDLFEFIQSIPAADVEPVRHGRWIHTDLSARWTGKDECSKCGYHEYDRSDLSHLNYCPNCGAKMDGDV